MAVDPLTGLPSSNTQRVYAGDRPIAPQIPQPVNPNVSATSINNTQFVSPPTPTAIPSSYYTGAINQLASQSQASVEANRALQEAQNQAGGVFNDYTALQSQLGGKKQDLANTYQNTGVNTAFNQLQDYNAQLQVLANEAKMVPLNVQENAVGRGVTTGIAQGQTEAGLRQNALRALTVGQGQAIAEGNYNKAKNIADQQIDIKYAQTQADLDSKKTQLDYLKNFVLSPAQERAKEERDRQYKKEEKEIADKKEEEKGIQNIGLTLGKYGVDDKIIKDVLASKDINEALIRAGSNLRDPKAALELQSLRADIALKGAQARKAEREATLTKEPTAAEKKAAAVALTQKNASAQAAQDKIDAVDSALNLKSGIMARVGPSILSRGIAGPLIGGGVAGSGLGPFGAVAGATAGGGVGLYSAFSGQGQQLSGAVHNLASGLTITSLIEAKKNGATFGALTEKELSLLAASATKLNDWEVKDKNGNPTGYWNIDEKSFKNELREIQRLSRKALMASGSAFGQDETSVLDMAFPEEIITPESYY